MTTARKRYQAAFFALGWLVALGIVVQTGMQRHLRSAYDAAAGRLSLIAQQVSDTEGSAWKTLRKQSRREQLARVAQLIATPDALRRPTERLYGAYDGALPHSFAGLDELETALNVRFPVISVYTAWGDRPEHQFPRRIVETVDRLGSVPMITWEPWVVDFDPVRRTHLPPRDQREYSALSAIARGDYNFYVQPWAKAAAEYGKPILLRFAHEMNDPYRYPWGPQNGNRPEDFIAAWKQVHEVFRKEGATNVLFVWSPHISAPWFEYYYPGGEYVDWVGATVLNYGDVANWSRWWTFDQIFNKAYPVLEKLGKPIVLSEFATVQSGGNAFDWYRDGVKHLDEKFPAVKLVVFFHHRSDSTITAQPIDWSLLQNPRTIAHLREQLATR